MKLRFLEVLAAIGCLILFIVLLVTLPGRMVGMEGLAYVVALVIFIATLGGAGYAIGRMAV
jgi:hypothetical protein